VTAAATAPAPSAFLKPPELVIGVLFTGVRRSSSRWRLLYAPPLTLAECLSRILDDLGTQAWATGLVRANPEREPPPLRESIVLHTAGKDVGRWPLAYLTADVGRIDLPALRQAFRDIGGRLD
jgi:hypothetical protein